MKRIWLLTAVLLLVPLQGQQSDPFLDRMIKFDRAWMAFKLEYLGCPKRYVTDEAGILVNCSGTGSVDVKLLRRAGKAAAEMFNLTEQP